MKLVVDVGNTNTVLGRARNGEIEERWRVQTRPGITPDELWHSWKPMLGDELHSRTRVLGASVVPDVTEALRNLLHRYLEVPPYLLESPWTDIPIRVAAGSGEDVGADRVAGAAAMYETYGTGIVVDFGTATTIDVVGEGGTYRGGVILPGVRSAAHGLASAAAKLPLISPRRPRKIACGNTVEAIQSGLFYGTAGAVQRVVDELRGEFSLDPHGPVVATGGMADPFRELCPTITHRDPNLVLRGIIQAFENATDNGGS